MAILLNIEYSGYTDKIKEKYLITIAMEEVFKSFGR